MTSGIPFDDFRALLGRLEGPDRAAGDAAHQCQRRLGEEAALLGRLGQLAIWLAKWSGRAKPAVLRPVVGVFAANHGIAAAGLSDRPLEWTERMVAHCAAGGAAVSQICGTDDIGLKVFDLALDVPTADITRDAALDERDCAATMAFGMEATAGGTDLFVVNGLGAGNNTVAAALLTSVLGRAGADWIGSDEPLANERCAAVDRALALHRHHLADPLEALRRVGGREFAAIAGAILAARMQKIPVVLDGDAALAVAAALKAANASAVDHCVLAARPVSLAGRRAIEKLALTPLIDLGTDLPAGALGAMAVGVLRTAVALHAGVQPLDQ